MSYSKNKLFFILFFLIFHQQYSFSQTITISAVGDILVGSSYPDSTYVPKSYNHFLKNIQSEFQKANLVLGNLEGVVSATADKPKKCSSKKNCYTFRMLPEAMKCLKKAGFDCLNLANNHSYDFGKTGLYDTYLEASNNKISTLSDLNTATFEYNEMTISLIGVCPYYPFKLYRDTKKMNHLIREFKNQGHIVIVFFHGGAEGKEFAHTPRYEEKQHGINHGNLVKTARSWIKTGADLVLGSGPHIVRGMEVYKDRLIAYSLGNFSTYGNMNTTGEGGLGVILRCTLNAKGKFLNGQLVSTKQISKGVVHKDTTHTAASTIKELSEDDFPESNLLISKSGEMSIDINKKISVDTIRTSKITYPKLKKGYYIVVGSFESEELVLDYQNELSKKNISTQISVHKYEEMKRFRLLQFVGNDYEGAKQELSLLSKKMDTKKMWILNYFHKE